MSGPVAIDATVKAMLELIDRAAEDTEFRHLCETDMAAAIARLGSQPAEGTSFEYASEGDGHVLRVLRGGETTTVSLSADGDLRIDNDALGVSTPSDESELSDVEMMAVAGGELTYVTDTCGCKDLPTTSLKQMCKAMCVCYDPNANNTGWFAINPCYIGGDGPCTGFREDGRASYTFPCDSQG